MQASVTQAPDLTRNRAAPFRCAEFSITAHKSGGRLRPERWLIDVHELDWDRLFAGARTGDCYDEAAFRRVAARSGWRLTTVVPYGDDQHRLYYERAIVR